jgi:uncharacterized protein (DUF433 family)
VPRSPWRKKYSQQNVSASQADERNSQFILRITELILSFSEIIVYNVYDLLSDQEDRMNSRIEINPNICHGKPVIRNTRVLVSNILADLAAGLSYAQIIENYPHIGEKDIRAVLEFGSELAQFETIPYDSNIL